VQLYIKGKRSVITIDDYIPFYGSTLLADNPSKVNGDWWAPILEKAWAKINNNYESVNNGW
jgi:hypothetical protein